MLWLHPYKLANITYHLAHVDGDDVHGTVAADNVDDEEDKGRVDDGLDLALEEVALVGSTRRDMDKEGSVLVAVVGDIGHEDHGSVDVPLEHVAFGLDPYPYVQDLDRILLVSFQSPSTLRRPHSQIR